MVNVTNIIIGFQYFINIIALLIRHYHYINTPLFTITWWTLIRHYAYHYCLSFSSAFIIACHWLHLYTLCRYYYHFIIYFSHYAIMTPSSLVNNIYAIDWPFRNIEDIEPFSSLILLGLVIIIFVIYFCFHLVDISHCH